MTNPNAASDWAAARGEKWRSQLSGMEAMLAPVNEPLLAALALDAPLRIAEVGSGGGGTSLEILRRAPAGSVVRGFDIAPSLVEAARARARALPDERARAIAFELADMATAAPDQPYDRLASRFGVMFFDDAHGAFSNLRRWLAPGGRFAFAVWGPTSENRWMASVREVVARLVDLPQMDPAAPGPFRYANADGFVALLAGAGFEDVAVNDWRGALPVGGALEPAEAAQFALAAFSNFGELLANAGGAVLDDARRSLTTLFTEHHREGAVRMDAFVHIVTGARR
jgi:SAM-dependent methyltransferase